MEGVEDSVVDLSGSGRFKPQSPRDRDDDVVSIAACVGYGSVAVSDSEIGPAVRLVLGGGRGGGKENNLECFRRLAVGESRLVAIPRFTVRQYRIVGLR